MDKLVLWIAGIFVFLFSYSFIPSTSAGVDVTEDTSCPSGIEFWNVNDEVVGGVRPRNDQTLRGIACVEGRLKECREYVVGIEYYYANSLSLSILGPEEEECLIQVEHRFSGSSGLEKDTLDRYRCSIPFEEAASWSSWKHGQGIIAVNDILPFCTRLDPVALVLIADYYDLLIVGTSLVLPWGFLLIFLVPIISSLPTYVAVRLVGERDASLRNLAMATLVGPAAMIGSFIASTFVLALAGFPVLICCTTPPVIAALGLLWSGISFVSLLGIYRLTLHTSWRKTALVTTVATFALIVISLMVRDRRRRRDQRASGD